MEQEPKESINKIEKLKPLKGYEMISFIDIIKVLCENREKINEIIERNKTKDKNQEGILSRIDNEITKLNDFIEDMNFIDNRECYAYKVAKEKLQLLNYLKGDNQ